VIDWLRNLGGVGELTVNMRQMENRVLDRGTAILDLADAYRRRNPALPAEEADPGPAEDILARIQEGGDVDKDRRVLFWNGHEDLIAQLVEHIIADIEIDTGASKDGNATWQF
jgi:exodeoxyribonuclease V alpha subunit